MSVDKEMVSKKYLNTALEVCEALEANKTVYWKNGSETYVITKNDPVGSLLGGSIGSGSIVYGFYLLES